MIRKLSMIALVLVMVTLTLAGCSTVEGAGKDLQDASNATRDAIKD